MPSCCNRWCVIYPSHVAPATFSASWKCYLGKHGRNGIAALVHHSPGHCLALYGSRKIDSRSIRLAHERYITDIFSIPKLCERSSIQSFYSLGQKQYYAARRATDRSLIRNRTLRVKLARHGFWSHGFARRAVGAMALLGVLARLVRAVRRPRRRKYWKRSCLVGRSFVISTASATSDFIWPWPRRFRAASPSSSRSWTLSNRRPANPTLNRLRRGPDVLVQAEQVARVVTCLDLG